MSDGRPMTCQNCNNTWTYTGQKPGGAYTNCPECYYKVQIPEKE